MQTHMPNAALHDEHALCTNSFLVPITTLTAARVVSSALSQSNDIYKCGPELSSRREHSHSRSAGVLCIFREELVVQWLLLDGTSFVDALPRLNPASATFLAQRPSSF